MVIASFRLRLTASNSTQLSSEISYLDVSRLDFFGQYLGANYSAICVCLIVLHTNDCLDLSSHFDHHQLNVILGPTKWLHLTPIAHESIDQVHFTIWQDTWKNPHASVDVADRVSREVLRSVALSASCLSVVT